MYILWCSGRVFYRYLLGPLDVQCHLIFTFLCLFFFLFVPSTGKIGKLKSLTINELELICVFKSSRTFYEVRYIRCSGEYTFRIVMSSWLLDSLVRMNCPLFLLFSFSLIIVYKILVQLFLLPSLSPLFIILSSLVFTLRWYS